MNVTVEYVAQMKDAAGVASESVALATEATVQDAVRDIAARHGDRLATLLLDEDNVLHPTALIFLDNEQVDWEDVRPLKDGDTITILAPLAGG